MGLVVLGWKKLFIADNLHDICKTVNNDCYGILAVDRAILQILLKLGNVIVTHVCRFAGHSGIPGCKKEFCLLCVKPSKSKIIHV